MAILYEHAVPHEYFRPYVMTQAYPDSKVHGANMGPTWVLSAPDGPHVDLMSLAIRVGTVKNQYGNDFSAVMKNIACLNQNGKK